MDRINQRLVVLQQSGDGVVISWENASQMWSCTSIVGDQYCTGQHPDLIQALDRCIAAAGFMYGSGALVAPPRELGQEDPSRVN